MKLTLKQAVDIRDLLRNGKQPGDVLTAAREGMSLDEVIRKLARDEVAVLKAHCQKNIDELQCRVSRYLNRPDVRKEINNAILSYFRHPRRAPLGAVAGRRATRW